MDHGRRLGPRRAAHGARDRGGRLGRHAGGRFAEPLRRSLRLACSRRHRHHTDRARHRRHQLGDPPRASGPKVIAMSALHAERVMFTLGADVERLQWGIELARKTRKDAGLDPDAIAFGAYINMGCHPDIEAARGLVRGGLTTFARFSVMHGKANGPVSAKDRDVLEALRTNYDMKAHTQGDSRQAGTLTDDFIDRFAIVGPPDRCIERLQSLAKLGLDKVAISGAARGAAPEDAVVARELIAMHVLPGMLR